MYTHTHSTAFFSFFQRKTNDSNDLFSTKKKLTQSNRATVAATGHKKNKSHKVDTTTTRHQRAQVGQWQRDCGQAVQRGGRAARRRRRARALGLRPDRCCHNLLSEVGQRHEQFRGSEDLAADQCQLRSRKLCNVR